VAFGYAQATRFGGVLVSAILSPQMECQMMEDRENSRSILVVESNSDHVQVIRAVLAEQAPSWQIAVVSDGITAMHYLHRQGSYTAAPRPDLILLDLDLPQKDGRTVLTEIKSAPALKRIPVIVLTLSDQEADILQTYTVQGNCYVIKTTDLQQITQIIQRIREFWLEIVTLPGE
jgi:two-component system, chemotaxis family, response regulator Rcp1